MLAVPFAWMNSIKVGWPWNLGQLQTHLLRWIFRNRYKQGIWIYLEAFLMIWADKRGFSKAWPFQQQMRPCSRVRFVRCPCLDVSLTSLLWYGFPWSKNGCHLTQCPRKFLVLPLRQDNDISKSAPLRSALVHVIKMNVYVQTFQCNALVFLVSWTSFSWQLQSFYSR